MSRQDDLRRLISKHQRHLQKLKEQQASFGLHTPAYMLTEIEDTEAEIENLQAQLVDLEGRVEETEINAQSRLGVRGLSVRSLEIDSSRCKVKGLSIAFVLLCVVGLGGATLAYGLQGKGPLAPLVAMTFPPTPTDATNTAVTETAIAAPTATPTYTGTATSTPIPILATPTPTTTIGTDQPVYDDFDNPGNDGSFNREKWFLDNTDGVCEVYQREGNLVFSLKNISSETGKGCILNGPSEVLGDRLELFETKIKISEDFSGNNAKTYMVMGCSGFTGGGWMECGLDALPNRVNAYFAIKAHGGKVPEFDRVYPVEYNRWYTLRYEVDPGTMKVSCFVDDNLVGTKIPDDASRLKNSLFQRYIQTYIEVRSSATTFIDDVRIIP